ncbi:IS110 family RNA-guided transposase [Gulosibacter molinativorax]|uniref:IS110 family transposase n=1 Tax=Gulosibacter molinativorax TaxID=256821 RepID=A0ABT7C4V2_9MICO|nr:IS110 family transposase [Gulosibacter molinativorax]MDJ1370226.1 IS110 family transposase [Gulosibacter molinativorax]QUY61639.1 Putative transposase [Gulosibacter molinativorax]
MTIVAHTRSFVIGVDTHARSHTYAVLDASNGQIRGCQKFPTTPKGIARAIAWAGRLSAGEANTLWVIEGAASYGAVLARTVSDTGYVVVEAPRMNAKARTGIGKSDPLDSQAIAAAVLPLSEHQLRQPRADSGTRQALRVLVAAREQMTQQKTMNMNALNALMRVNVLGVDARSALTLTLIREVSRWRSREEPLALSVAREETVRLAKEVLSLHDALAANQARLTELIAASEAAPLLEEPGIGAYTAAVVIAAWSHPGRVRSEAAFAALAGVNPIPASSGNTVRYRLNRGGDRRLNHALHVIAMSRMTYHPETKTYVEKRLAEGKSKREIRRCIKRYHARHLYRTLNALNAVPAAT